LALEGLRKTVLKNVPESLPASEREILLQVHIVGLRGSDLNSYRGTNPLVSYPRIPGSEIADSVAARYVNINTENIAYGTRAVLYLGGGLKSVACCDGLWPGRNSDSQERHHVSRHSTFRTFGYGLRGRCGNALRSD